jgi:hypothetical protein
VTYQGLGQYGSRPDPLARVEGESEENWLRRTAIHRRFAEQAADESDAWQEHRARVDRDDVGSGSGLFGRLAPESRRAALVARGIPADGGEQRLQYRGGQAVTAVPGSVAIPAVYRSQLVKDDQRPGSPLTQHLRASGEGIYTTRG